MDTLGSVTQPGVRACFQQLVDVCKCCAHFALPFEKNVNFTAFVALQRLLDAKHCVLQRLHIHALAQIQRVHSGPGTRRMPVGGGSCLRVANFCAVIDDGEVVDITP
jgi:hypothetical protein